MRARTSAGLAISSLANRAGDEHRALAVTDLRQCSRKTRKFPSPIGDRGEASEFQALGIEDTVLEKLQGAFFCRDLGDCNIQVH